MRSLFVLFALIFVCPSLQAITIDLEKAPPPAKKHGPNLKGPVVLDARPAFEYSMEHYELALPIRWEDFDQTEDPHKGDLDPDAGFLARRLRIYGITPDREVIILGKGTDGHGEEGRIAWMLKFLGIKHVQIVSYDKFKGKKVSGEQPEVDAAPLWLPKIQEDLRARLPDVQQWVSSKSANVLLVDVRTPEEFSHSGHIPGAINIPWTKFVDEQTVNQVLGDYKVTTDKEIVFYSRDGVASGYAAFAALSAGRKARNFDGSFLEWTGEMKNVEH